MGMNTGVSSKEDVLNQLVGPLKTTDPRVTKSLYDQASKNYDFASSEAQKALRSGASQEQAADIFAQSLQHVAQVSSNGTMRYPDTTLQAVKNAITRGGLGFGRDIANIAALGAGAIGAGTTSRELLGQSQKLEDISSQYPGQFASTEEALAKGDTLEDKAKNLAMRALEGSIENAPSMLSSIGGASGARLLATKGIEAYAAKYGRKASEDLLEKASKWGVASGALATSTGLEAGSIYKDIYDKTGELHPGVATAFGTLAGALDAIVPIQAANTVSTLARKEMIESLGKTIAQRYGVDALKSIGEEAATEFLQTFIEKGGVSFVNGDPVFNKANLNEALDAAFIGAAMGGGTHLTSQAIQDLLMKTQGMSREDAKKYYESEFAADKAQKEATDKWKTKGLTPKTNKINLPTISPEAAAADQGQLFTQPGGTPPVVETPEQKKAKLVKQFIDNGHTKDNANLLADQQIKEAENAGRTDSGTTGEGVQVPGRPAPVEPTGRTEQPIGAPVVGAGSTAGTTAQGTVQQSAPLTPTSGLVDLMHASDTEFKSPAQVKAFLNKVAPDEIAPLAEANPKIYKAILDEWKNTPAPVQEAPAEEAPAEEAPAEEAPVEESIALAKDIREQLDPTDPVDAKKIEQLDAHIAKLENVPTSKSTSNVNSFMEDYYKATGQSLSNSRERVHDNEVGTEVYPQDNVIYLKDIRSFKPGESTGAGSRALKTITDLADKYGLIIEGTAQAYSPSGLSDEQLKSWYERKGFTVDDMGNMERKPKAAPQAQEIVQEQAAPEAPPAEAPVEQVAPQVSERERAAAERIRQQQEEAAAEKAVAAEEFKRTQIGAPPQAIAAEEQAPIETTPEENIPEEEMPSPVTTPEEDANFEKAKDTVGAFVRQTIGGVETIAPEDVVSTAQALASLVDIMHHIIKKGARNFADALATAKAGLGIHAQGITDSQFKTAYDAAEKIQSTEAKSTEKFKKTKLPKVKDAMLRIKRSNNAAEVGNAIGDLITANNFDDVKEQLADAMDYLDSKRLQALLPNLSTSQIVITLGKDIPHLTTVVAAVDHMSVMRNKMLANISKKSDRWVEFNHKHPKQGMLLSDVMHFARLQRIDFSAFTSLQNALAKDPILLKAKKNRDKATKTQERSNYQGQVNARIASITEGYKQWNQLNAEAHGIFKDVKTHYEEMFNLQRAILDERVTNAKVPGDVNDATTPKGRLMAAIRKTYETVQEEGGVYFPFMRYGTYWLRVGTGEAKEFYMYESEWDRDRAERRRVRELRAAGDTRTKDEMLEAGDLAKGNRMDQSRDDAAASDELLKGVFKAIDSQKAIDKEALKDSVYQLYLLSMPEQAFRKKYVHAKGTTGFNPDALRNFVRSGYTNANQLAKLKYGPEIRNSIDSARKSLERNPDEYKLDMVVNEIEKRVDLEFSPVDEDRTLVRAVNGINQFVFLWRITSPRSALVNLTALPNFGLPTLISEFGEVKGTVGLAKYSKVWEHLAVVTPDGKFVPVSVGSSAHVQNSPVLKQAFEEAVDREITEITRTHDMIAMGSTPSAQYKNKVTRGYVFGVNAAGYLFHHTERLNREIMFMTSFELAYNKYLEEMNLGHLIGTQVINDEAYEKAIIKAIELTNKTMFNYTRFNRPRYMRHTILKPAVQFRMYAQQVTENLTTSFLRMLPFVKGNTAKRAAAKQFFGTLMMVGLEAGIVGMPFPIYWLITHTLHALFAKKRREDDPPPMEEINLDLWFRNEWLPQVFGEYAKPVMKGPISYYSNVDIGSGTSLANIWFRDSRSDPSTETTLRNIAFDLSFGAAGGVATDFLSGYDDIRTGHVDEGINKFLPAPLKGPQAAYYWSKEGVMTKNQMAPFYRQNEVTTGMLITKSMGFNPTELSIMQEFNYPMKQIEQDLLHQRAEIMDRMNIGLAHHKPKVFQQAMLDATKFTRAYPELGFDDADKIYDSLTKRAEIRAMADHGLVIDPRIMPRVYKFAHASRPHRSKEEEAAMIDSMVETQNKIEEEKARIEYNAANPDEE